MMADVETNTINGAEQKTASANTSPRLTFDRTSEGVFGVSSQWRLTSLTGRALAHTVDGRDFIGRVIWEAMPGLTGTRLEAALRRCMAERTAVEAEDFYAQSTRRLSARVFSSDDGGILVFYRDITEERRTEQGVRELLETLDLAAIFIRELAGAIRYWSAGCERLYGWSASEAVGRDAHELLHTTFPQPRSDIAKTLEQEGVWTGDLRQQTRDGSFVTVLARKALHRDETGRPSAVLESLTDVTQVREAERRLAESELRFRGAVAAVGGVVWTANAKGEMVGEQPGWQKLTGQSAEESAGVGGLAAVHPDDRARSLAAWRKAVASQRELALEHRVRRSDGVWRDFAVRAIPLFDDQYAVREWVGVHIDITDQREAEGILARYREELERAIAERTRDLEQIRERLVHAQRVESLGRLAGGIAHDFNNVLQAIDGAANLIDQDASAGEAIHRRTRRILDAAARGASITRRLLTFARQGDLRAETIDPAALLASMQEILAHTLGSATEVRFEASETLPPLLADRSQLETVLVNLATNARDAMPGGGTLMLTAELEALGPSNVPLLPEGNYIRIAVSDTGTGMSPEVLARAAEPFFTTKTQAEGTGLGLAMAKGFATQSGGALLIESMLGQGTTIHLWLPVAARLEEAVPLSDDSASDATASPRPYRVLLVDDDPLVRETTAEQLEIEGYPVISAGSAVDALALIEAGDPVDVLISDLSMPGMSGLALIGEAQRRRAGLRAILLTGFAGTAEELAVGLTNPVAALLRKPVSARELSARLKALLAPVR